MINETIERNEMVTENTRYHAPETLRRRTSCLLALALTICSLPALAQTDVLVVEGGNVGVGISTPSELFHVRASDGTAKLLVEETGGASFQALMELFNEDGNVGFRLTNNFGLADFNKVGDEFRINIDSSPPELRLQSDGDLIIRGSLFANDGANIFPDYVFADDYELMPIPDLAEFVRTERHLPGVMSAKDVEEAGTINVSKLQLQLLEKVEELSLYVVRQHETIEAQSATIEALAARLAELERR